MKNVKLFLAGLVLTIIGFKFVDNFWLLGFLGLELIFFAAIFSVVDWFKKGITIKIIDPNDKD